MPDPSAPAVPSGDPPAGDHLAPFHPLIRGWFTERVGTPTDVQVRAWPEIAAGRHVLVTAPTGSGKTLTAFLWALDRLFTGAWAAGGKPRVLYVSPLKALNADVERNLLGPLSALKRRFEEAGEEAPSIRVVTRSGDTPQSVRQRMVRRPPEILITTPESLNLLLTSQGGRSILDGLETVILDEIHAVAGNKRGTHLITAVERLTLLSGEFQRVALSATVRPLERIARFVGGHRRVAAVGPEDGAEDGVRDGAEPAGGYEPRPVALVRSADEKRYEVAVRFPAPRPEAEVGAAREPDGGEDSIWDQLAPELGAAVEGHNSTLIFTNSRRATEKLTRLINDERPAPLVYSHHGSLSKEVRQVVERRLKEGELSGLVSTSSLELGIDIGDLDQVVLVQTPPTIASAVQRIGRAGHRVGETSRGTFYPLYGRDLLDAAVFAKAVLDGDIEEVRPVERPLDVLAQVILSMVVAERWQVDELFAFLRTAEPYRKLSRRQLDLVIEMLAGRYSATRVNELKARLALDKVDGTLTARPGAARLLYMSGGTIPDRGYFHLRLKETMSKLGELDEEFVWERSVGDTFTLGTQAWRIASITHNDVLVTPARGAASAMPPFWRADERDRSFHASRLVARFLEEADERLEEPDFERRLEREYRLDREATAELLGFLRQQRAATGALPHRGRLIVERIEDPQGRSERRQVILHTLWGGRINRPLALALAAVCSERFPELPLQVLNDDDCILLVAAGELPEPVPELLAQVVPEQLELLLRRRLGATGFFGARFRQNAGRALLLPRAGFRHRTPLWLLRRRAKQLLEGVSRYDDFPITVETWRSCLQDEMELDRLKELLAEVAAGDIEVREVSTAIASPLAGNLVWKDANLEMYEDDTPAGRGAGVAPDLLRELVLQGSLRPRLPAALIAELEAKLQRLHPGYAPRDAGELLELVKERVLLPLPEWRRLLDAVERDGAAGDEDEEGSGESEGGVEGAGGGLAARLVAELADRLVRVTLPGAAEGGVAAIEQLPRLAWALGLAVDRLAVDQVAERFDLAAIASAGEEGAEDLQVPPGEGALAALAAVIAAWRPPDGHAVAAEAADGDAADAPADPAAELLVEWARFYGPFPAERPARLFGGAGEADTLSPLLTELSDAGRLVVDQLREGSDAIEVCHAENLETLLRWARAAARPRFEALPLDRLPLFLAAHQGLVRRPPSGTTRSRGPEAAAADGMEALERRLEQLLAWPAPAAAWEGELLPARLDPYYPAWLDSLMQESGLLWVGVGKEKITFTLPDERQLLAAGDRAANDQAADGAVDGAADGAVDGGDPDEVGALFPDPRGHYRLDELARHGGVTVATAHARLWRAAWRGRVTNDALIALRRGVIGRFEAPAESGSTGAAAAPRAGRGATGAHRPRRLRRGGPQHPGRWRLLPAAPAGDAWEVDALEQEERNKQRVRILLDRYGILFRQLTARELPAFRWGALFRTLRIMELSGELLAGYFFQDIPGPQFIAPRAFRMLEKGLPEDGLFWLNATDPASPCGLALDGLKGDLPRRHPSTHLAYLGTRLVAVSQRSGRGLDLRLPPDHPRLTDALGFLKVLAGREVNPVTSLTIEEINGEPAARSPYLEALEGSFQLSREVTAVRLWRRY